MAQAITAEEIKAIRGRYGLSQRSFAVLLGIGPASIVRYEQGSAPSKANANLIRAARNPQFMRECLENDGDHIPKAQRAAAERVIYEYISLDPEENERMHAGQEPYRESPYTMDEMYHFTLQQEILNEQAANLIGDIIARRLSDGFSPGTEVAMSSLLHMLSRLKPTIVSSATLNDGKLSQIRGQLELATDLVNRAKAMGVCA